VNGTSVILYFDGKTLEGHHLSDLVESLAATITKIRGEKEVLLVGPLNTKISEVGPQVMMFALKQKWALT